MTKTVLIIDDDKTVLHLLEKRLGALHTYHVLIAENGNIGLELARHHHPDVILLDVMMPDKSGGEVARILHEDEATKNIPIIFITVLLEAGGKKRIVFDDREYRAVPKPVYLPELLSQIRKTLNEIHHGP